MTSSHPLIPFIQHLRGGLEWLMETGVTHLPLDPNHPMKDRLAGHSAHFIPSPTNRVRADINPSSPLQKKGGESHEGLKQRRFDQMTKALARLEDKQTTKRLPTSITTPMITTPMITTPDQSVHQQDYIPPQADVHQHPLPTLSAQTSIHSPKEAKIKETELHSKVQAKVRVEQLPAVRHTLTERQSVSFETLLVLGDRPAGTVEAIEPIGAVAERLNRLDQYKQATQQAAQQVAQQPTQSLRLDRQAPPQQFDRPDQGEDSQTQKQDSSGSASKTKKSELWATKPRVIPTQTPNKSLHTSPHSSAQPPPHQTESNSKKIDQFIIDRDSSTSSRQASSRHLTTQELRDKSGQELKGGLESGGETEEQAKTAQQPIELKASVEQEDYAWRREDGAWRELIRSLTHCEKCGRCDATSTVNLGMGSRRADLVFVTSHPSEYSAQLGVALMEPGVGPLFTNILKAIKLNRAEVYITSLLKCSAQQPNPKEWAVCRDYFDQELHLIRPKVIVTLGALASQILTGQNHRCGVWGTYHSIPLFSTLHPLEIERGGDRSKETCWKHLKQLMRHLKER